jgi:hypothetical protein
MHRRTAQLAVCTALILVATGCEERSRSTPAGDEGGDPGGGPGTQRCQDDDECSDPTPFCSGGACSATDDGGAGGSEGIGGNEGGVDGEGEGEAGAGDDEAGDDEGGDGGQPGDGSLCSICTGLDEGECGEGGRCILFRDQNKYCSTPCGEGNTCDPGFECVEQWDPPQCLPIAAACIGNCAVEGCRQDGEICDFALGVCRTPKGHCERCSTDEECENGGCAQLAEAMYCVADCVEGADDCPAGSSCAGAFCMPDGGICDRCDGVDCQGLTPFCEPITGECAACLTDNDCGQGSFCALGECREAQGECLSNGDCAGNPQGPHCFVDRCVECIATEHCPPQHRCDVNVCVEAPCEGVLCQGQAECSEQTGRCEPGCQADGDCLEGQGCDPQTGQCYNSDGTCDADSPCRPGSSCDGGGGLPGEAAGTACSCPGNIISCQGPEDCPGFPGGCTPQFSTCQVACDQGCRDGWSCGGFLCEADNKDDFCHPGMSCNAFSGKCSGS